MKKTFKAVLNYAKKIGDVSAKLEMEVPGSKRAVKLIDNLTALQASLSCALDEHKEATDDAAEKAAA